MAARQVRRAVRTCPIESRRGVGTHRPVGERGPFSSSLNVTLGRRSALAALQLQIAERIWQGKCVRAEGKRGRGVVIVNRRECDRRAIEER